MDYDSLFSDFKKRERHVFKKSAMFNQKLLAEMKLEFDGISFCDRTESDINI